MLPNGATRRENGAAYPRKADAFLHSIEDRAATGMGWPNAQYLRAFAPPRIRPGRRGALGILADAGQIYAGAGSVAICQGLPSFLGPYPGWAKPEDIAQLGHPSRWPHDPRCCAEKRRPFGGYAAHSRDVLRRFGNMSSATVMFVLREMLQPGTFAGRGCAMAFGPASQESMLFQTAGTDN